MDLASATAVVGTLAAIASTASFAPQAWRIIRTRDVKGLSPAAYALTVAAFALWLSYGALRRDWALIVPNVLCLALAAFILTMTLLPRARRERVADAIEAATTENPDGSASALAGADREA